MIFSSLKFDLNRFINANRTSKCAEIDININDGNALLSQEVIMNLYGGGCS